MKYEDVEKSMRDRFWELDDQIRSTMAELAKHDSELNDIAAQEAKIRERRQKIAEAKNSLVQNSGMVEKARERSRIANFLDRKTGTRDNH